MALTAEQTRRIADELTAFVNASPELKAQYIFRPDIAKHPDVPHTVVMYKHVPGQSPHTRTSLEKIDIPPELVQKIMEAFSKVGGSYLSKDLEVYTMGTSLFHGAQSVVTR